MLTRRQLLKTGVAGGALLSLARIAYGPMQADAQFVVAQKAPFRVLDAQGRTALAAIARVVLKGALPRQESELHAALEATVHGCDTAIAGLPGSVQDEVKELLALLNNRFARRWVVGVIAPWNEASDDHIEHFLSRWRYSSFLLLRSGYQALHQIIFAAWYGNPSSWSAIGYDGPPEFMKAFWNA